MNKRRLSERDFRRDRHHRAEREGTPPRPCRAHDRQRAPVGRPRAAAALYLAGL
jgi:hypothetical protein